MVHYRPKSPQVLTRHARIYKLRSATKQTKLRLLSLLQARYLLYKKAKVTQFRLPHRVCTSYIELVTNIHLLFAHTSEALEVFALLATTYCLLCSLVEHSSINPKSLNFGYLDEKPIDVGLMKFFGLCPSTLFWYLEFAFAFSTSFAPFTANALPP
ncbi:hypothetical protein GW17_00027275 [Ensete ventricosum]|nr:hypothetical protein GW17_00027275 [Ensete ventricosum]